MRKDNVLFYSRYKSKTKIKIASGLLTYVIGTWIVFYHYDKLQESFGDNSIYFYFAGFLLMIVPFALWVSELEQILVYPDYILIRVIQGKRISYDRYEWALITAVSYIEGTIVFKFGDGLSSEKKFLTSRLECMSSRGLRVSWERFAEDLQSRLKN